MLTISPARQAEFMVISLVGRIDEIVVLENDMCI